MSLPLHAEYTRCHGILIMERRAGRLSEGDKQVKRKDDDGHIARRLQALGVDLPDCPAPLGAYVPALAVGDLVYTSGMLPLTDGDLAYVGPVGPVHTVDAGAAAAKLCAQNAVAAIAGLLGGVAGLDRVTRVVQVTGHILCLPDFAEQPAVLNGASEWLAELFGEPGRHTRLALGAHALPKNATVELAMVVQVATH